MSYIFDLSDSNLHSGIELMISVSIRVHRWVSQPLSLAINEYFNITSRE